MSKIQRLALLVVLAWLLAAGLAWLTLSPPQPLVGGKQSRSSLVEEGWRLERVSLDNTLLQLENQFLWGVNRDGSPLPPPVSKEEEEKARIIAWRVIAAVVRADERYALITVEQEPAPRAVKEGEDLPNGGKLMTVSSRRVVYLDAEGKQHTDILNF